MWDKEIEGTGKISVLLKASKKKKKKYSMNHVKHPHDRGEIWLQFRIHAGILCIDQYTIDGLFFFLLEFTIGQV